MHMTRAWAAMDFFWQKLVSLHRHSTLPKLKRSASPPLPASFLSTTRPASLSPYNMDLINLDFTCFSNSPLQHELDGPELHVLLQFPSTCTSSSSTPPASPTPIDIDVIKPDSTYFFNSHRRHQTQLQMIPVARKSRSTLYQSC